MIEIINQQKRYRINTKIFKSLVNKLLKFYKIERPEIIVAFVNNKTIQILNHKFLGKKAPTDVLSFPIKEKAVDGKFYFGDIIISVPIAKKQSVLKKHSLERELQLLTLHGFLHLYGFEHYKGLEEEEKKMTDVLIGNEHGI